MSVGLLLHALVHAFMLLGGLVDRQGLGTFEVAGAGDAVVLA